MLPVEVSSKIELEGVTLVNPTAQKIVLAGNPKDEDVTPIKENFEVHEHGFDYILPSYSFTVIRIGQKMDK